MRELVIFVALVMFFLWVIWMMRQPRESAGEPVRQEQHGHLNAHASGDNYQDGSNLQPDPVQAQAHHSFWDRQESARNVQPQVDTHSHTINSKETAGMAYGALNRSDSKGEQVRK